MAVALHCLGWSQWLTHWRCHGRYPWVMLQPLVVIVTPALAQANNGNWQTAKRWASFLSGHYRVELTEHWPGRAPTATADLMLALHARRSAPSIQAWRELQAAKPLVLAMTGTDLYRDIISDPAAQRSLALADTLIVLNQMGVRALPQAMRSKAVVCLQSCPMRRAQTKTTRHLRALMVGHLREEKSPGTFFEAARLLAQRKDILLDHIGDGLDPALAQQAQQLMQSHANYRWLGALPHGKTRARIAAAHVLVHPSRMEGGAHVVMEAVTSGTPVLASRIDGNLGLLGADYVGTFEFGDAKALATMLQQCRDEPAMLAILGEQCDARRSLFLPERERHTLLTVLAQALGQKGRPNA